jgi:hypothetical protein
MNILNRYAILPFPLQRWRDISNCLSASISSKADDFIRLRQRSRSCPLFLYNLPIITPFIPISLPVATLLSLGALSRHRDRRHAVSRISLGASCAGVCRRSPDLGRRLYQ